MKLSHPVAMDVIRQKRSMASRPICQGPAQSLYDFLGWITASSWHILKLCEASKRCPFLSNLPSHFLQSRNTKMWKSKKENKKKKKKKRFRMFSCRYGIMWRKYWQAQVSMVAKSMNGSSREWLSFGHYALSCWHISWGADMPLFPGSFSLGM